MTGNNERAVDVVVPWDFQQAEPAYDECDIGYEAAQPALQALLADVARATPVHLVAGQAA